MSLHQIVVFNLLLGTGLGLLLWSMSVRHQWARVIVILLLIVVTLKYATWRIVSLPDLMLNLGSVWPWVFFLLEIPAITYEMWTYVVMTRHSDNTPDADLYEVRLRSADDLPTVDVFIATYDEPLGILKETIEAAQQQDYPHRLLRVVVGDDGNRPDLKRLAERLGVEYFARPDAVDEHGGKSKIGGGGKAGNDRFSFTQTQGEYIILLDADFRLHPTFIYRTLGFLLYRSDIGLVQTPQRFSNPDVISKNLLAPVPDDQHFFMTITEPARDAWGNSFCTGTACIVPRRLLKKLDPVWGFPNHSICEDLELSYALLGAGFRTLYLNEPLAYGLAPASIPDFLKQRVRWCAGTVQNLFAPTGPIRGRLRVLDRVFYCEGVLYWLGSVFTVLLIVAPVVFWFSGVSAVLGTPEAAAAVVLPRIISREIIMYWLSEGKIPPLVVNVSRTLPAFHVSWVFVKTLLQPRSPVFSVTGKKLSCERLVVRWPLFLLYSSIACATLFGMFTTLVGRSKLSPNSDLIHLNIGWSSLSTLICVLCSLACVELPKTASADEPEVIRCNPIKITAALVRRCLGCTNQQTCAVPSVATSWLRFRPGTPMKGIRGLGGSS